MAQSAQMASISASLASRLPPRVISQPLVRQPEYQHAAAMPTIPRELATHGTEAPAVRPGEIGASVMVTGVCKPHTYLRGGGPVAEATGLGLEHGALPWFVVAKRASLLQVLAMEAHAKAPALPPPLSRSSAAYRPRTRLGKKLWELRSQLVASGAKLLDWDDIEREVAARRESARAERA